MTIQVVIYLCLIVLLIGLMVGFVFGYSKGWNDREYIDTKMPKFLENSSDVDPTVPRDFLRAHNTTQKP